MVDRAKFDLVLKLQDTSGLMRSKVGFVSPLFVEEHITC
ncbi:hypothetical protein ACP70R_047733 [Stipagrostis hirtigluma subsp. patula]